MGRMALLLMLKEVILPVKSSGVTTAGVNRAAEALRPVNFAVVPSQTGFVTENSAFAVWNLADVRPRIFGFMSSVLC